MVKLDSKRKKDKGKFLACMELLSTQITSLDGSLKSTLKKETESLKSTLEEGTETQKRNLNNAMEGVHSQLSSIEVQITKDRNENRERFEEQEHLVEELGQKLGDHLQRFEDFIEWTERSDVDMHKHVDQRVRGVTKKVEELDSKLAALCDSIRPKEDSHPSVLNQVLDEFTSGTSNSQPTVTSFQYTHERRPVECQTDFLSPSLNSVSRQPQ